MSLQLEEIKDRVAGLDSNISKSSWGLCVCVCATVKVFAQRERVKYPSSSHLSDRGCLLLYEVTGGQPEYIYAGTFMNLGERALTGNYRPTQRRVSINTGLNCIHKRLQGKG